eukprot:TRINITY_DN8820_c0_g1_i2.p1 TRINITY_DN8820_c0_g1~~TRINITY_DN8820_c0_g1_i2.p1  ORF type:complete len:249 (-),score=32.07 TRINITY_DN8820_c0_g1_i2:73-819(-)
MLSLGSDNAEDAYFGTSGLGVGLQASVGSGDFAGNSRPHHWLLRLGSARGRGRSSGNISAAEHGWGSRLSGSERARHAILSWRLKRPYLVYCFGCAGLTLFLLVWNLVKGVQNDWNLPQWKHHFWEEALEVSIGVLIVVETMITMRVIGLRAFVGSCWCLFDLAVALLTAVSICYGLKHLGRRGEICEADVPLLLMRFILQPARVLAALASTYRTRQMQSEVDELRVDFDALPARGATAHFEEMRDMS